MSRETLLEVHGLTVRYEGVLAPALCELDFGLAAGEVLGVLGESGSGKTTLALALLRLLPPGGRITAGSIRFREVDLLARSEKEMTGLRGAELALVFQEPALALSPVLRVGDQVAEVLRAHRRTGKRERRAEAARQLEEVGLRDAARLRRAYPHQLSGGERQRVAIAQALCCRPRLVVADEPTSALDTTLQAEMVHLLEERRRRDGSALVFITHHPALLAGWADRVLVLHGGRIVEEGPCREVLAQPKHPRTRALLEAVPPPPERAAVRG